MSRQEKITRPQPGRSGRSDRTASASESFPDAPAFAVEPARILVVEDQEDVRRLLVTALQIEGHIVDEAANARDGLKRLQDAHYQLVLSDYAMPGGTGTWMLHEATRQGLLNDTVALIVTAHPDIRELSDVEVITKPLDLDNFLEQVRRVLAAGNRHSKRPSTGSGRRPSTTDSGPRRQPPYQVESHPRVELVLYVSASSPASIQARRNLEALLEQFVSSQVKLSVCDLGRDPLAGDADHVAFTPTLVKRFPEPKMWILGSLRDTEVVGDLLRVSGVDSKA